MPSTCRGDSRIAYRRARSTRGEEIRPSRQAGRSWCRLARVTRTTAKKMRRRRSRSRSPADSTGRLDRRAVPRLTRCAGRCCADNTSHGGRMLTRLAIAPIVLSLWAVAGCSHPVQVVSSGDVSGDVIPATASALPVGTTLEVQLDQPISAKDSRVGDRFTAHVTKPVVAQNGAVVVPAGAFVEGHVTGIEPSRDPTRPALIRLDFDALRFGDR